MAAEVGHAQKLAERLPLRRRHDGDADPALLAAIDAHRIGRREAVETPAFLRCGGRPSLDGLVLGERDGGLVNAHLVAQALPTEQRGHCWDEGGQPAHDRRLVVRQGKWRAFLWADQLHEARQRAADGITGLEVAIGAGPAEPREIDGDERRLCTVVGAGRIDQHVGAAQQAVEIHIVRRDALLAVVEVSEPAAAAVDQRRKGAVGIAAGRLDLDDLGAEVGEQARRIGGRRQGADLDDADARQASLHSATAALAGRKLGITSRAKARRLPTEALGSTSRMLVTPPASSCFSRAITSSGVPSSGAVSSSMRSGSLSRARSPITLTTRLRVSQAAARSLSLWIICSGRAVATMVGS